MINSYTVFDLETTGLSPVYDKIIEIGAVKIREGKPVEYYETLVNPNRKIDQKIEELTGIKTEMLIDEPSISEILEKFLDFVGDDVIMGHNVMFDYSFIKQEAFKQKLSVGTETNRLCVDTLKLARKCLPDLASRKLDDLCTVFKIADENHHRAMNDAIVTHQLYRILCERFENEDKFDPEPIFYKPKKIRMATERQKDFLRSLLVFHGIQIDMDIEQMTQNEVNRYADRIISKFGRPT